MFMTIHWDKRLSILLKEKGYNHDQVMEIIGIIAEERQQCGYIIKFYVM